MDPSLTSGGIIATIGIGTVFFSLVTLILVVGTTTRLSSSRVAAAESGGAQEPTPEPAAEPIARAASSEGEAQPAAAEPQPAGAEPDYQRIALSAYAHHRRITTRVKSDEPSTSWAMAGRIRELNQRTGRN